MLCILVNCKLTVLFQYIGFIVAVFCIMAAGVVCALVFKTWVYLLPFIAVDFFIIHKCII